MCDEQGIPRLTPHEGGLPARVKALRAKHQMPPLHERMIGHLKALGDKAVHEAGDVTPAQAQALDEFFGIIAEYVYVAPARVERFRAWMASSPERVE